MHVDHKNGGYNYYTDGKIMDAVEQEKDLGIIISEDLKMSEQRMQAYAKTSRMLGAICRTIKFKDKYIFLSLYKSPVRPHSEYCTSAWSPPYVKDKELYHRTNNQLTYTSLSTNKYNTSFSKYVSRFQINSLK